MSTSSNNRSESKLAPLQNRWPEFLVSCPSRLLFCWMNRLLWNGYKRGIGFHDLWTIDVSDDARTAHKDFEINFNKQLLSEKDRSTPPRKWFLLRVMFRTHGLAIVISGFFMLCYVILTFVAPLMVRLLMKFLKSEEPDWHGYVFVLLLVFGQIFRSYFYQHQNQITFHIFVRLKAAIMSSIYRKSLILNAESRNENTVGKIGNLISVDAARFTDTETACYIHLIWASLLQILIGFCGLYMVIGWSFLPGVLVYLAIFIINVRASSHIQTYQELQMAKKDERLNFLAEIFSGIKVIKLYAWEKAFLNKVSKIRELEISYLRTLAQLNGATEVSWSCTNLLASLSIFGFHLLFSKDKILTADDAFTVITVLNILSVPLSMFPITFYSLSAMLVSIGRIAEFLAAEELDEYAESNKNSPFAIELYNATFSYSKTKPPALHNVSFKIKRGTLIAIVGPVGSGKSTIIKALLGEMNKISGRVLVNGSTGYVPQQAWLQNLTVQDNILFSKKLRQDKYRMIVLACSLSADFKNLVASDQTELGESGVNLSGGQKQRLNLARSVYQNCDIYLLDSPLSAVDVQVGKHIFENVISHQGILNKKDSMCCDCQHKHKMELSRKNEYIQYCRLDGHNQQKLPTENTRIIVTHGLGNLHDCDQIVYVQDGRVQGIGTFQELIRQSANFRDFVADYVKNIKERELEDMDKTELMTLQESPTTFDALKQKQHEVAISRSSNSLSDKTLLIDDDVDSTATTNVVEKLKQLRAGKIIEMEEISSDRIPWSIYMSYSKSAPKSFLCHAIFSCLVQIDNAFSSIWVERWTDKNYSWDLGLGIYGLCALLIVIFTVSYVVGLVAFQTRASTVVHAKLIESLFKCPPQFFDTVPVGRIMNRCGKDIDVVDTKLPMVMSNAVFFVCLFVVSISVAFYVTPFYIIPFVPILAGYMYVQMFYVRSSRQFRRLEAVSRSPIYSYLQESFLGSSVIRSFNQTNRFCRHFDKLINTNSVAQLCLTSTNSWLGVHLETVGALMVGAAALLAVIQRASLSAGSVGLSITTILMLTELLQWGVKEIGLLETEAVALERIAEYTNAKYEAEWSNAYGLRLVNWPSKGIIEFKNYSTAYRSGGPLVVKNLSFRIESGEKIGIVGRTGAGKSSITLAIFRLIEPVSGTICIDNIDISLLGLHDLREKLTIIPQDPVLFSGTLRSNIDPFDEYSEEQLWSIIEMSKMQCWVATLEDRLEFKISECGQNLSVGQRQVICLWRALLRKSKILILDEATAAVDMKMDTLIQETITTHFRDCTVITVAHRLNTIMDSSRILVLEDGSLAEYGSPTELLRNSSSIFSQMAAQARTSILTAPR